AGGTGRGGGPRRPRRPRSGGGRAARPHILGHRDAGDEWLRRGPAAAPAARPGKACAGGDDRLGAGGGSASFSGGGLRPPSHQAGGTGGTAQAAGRYEGPVGVSAGGKRQG